MRRNLALTLVLLLGVAGNAFAGAEARMTGKILDAATKAPVANATVKVEAVEGKNLKLEAKVNKNEGTYALFLLDSTIKYKYIVSAPGYDTYEEVIKLKIGDNTSRDFMLNKAGTAAAAAGAAQGGAKPAPVDPAVIAYNEGAALANAGDHAGAIKKFEEAVTAKPNLTAGWIALARTQVRQKNYPKAIEAANKVLEVDDTDNDMLAILVESYNATGDKAKAAAAQAKLPKNAGALYNDAAKLINSGDDAGAEKLLKQAVDVDESFAMAHYQLGMIYVRTGKTADAKAELQKYLELDPKGAEAGTAKEMLGYLK